VTTVRKCALRTAERLAVKEPLNGAERARGLASVNLGVEASRRAMAISIVREVRALIFNREGSDPPMANWQRLTQMDGTHIWLNLDLATRMGMSGDRTWIAFAGKKSVLKSESPQQT